MTASVKFITVIALLIVGFVSMPTTGRGEQDD